MGKIPMSVGFEPGSTVCEMVEWAERVTTFSRKDLQ